jgi:hypothetical protein
LSIISPADSNIASNLSHFPYITINNNANIGSVGDPDAILIATGGGVTLSQTLGVTGVITADAGIDVHNFNLDGTTLALSSGNMTIESAGEMILKQGGGIVRVYAGSTQVGALTTSSDNFGLKSFVSDKDIYIIGNDGGSTITALTLDMSEAGRVYFNSDIGISDSKVLRIGSDSDLQLYHDNTHSYINNGTGNLFIEADQFYFRNSARTEYYASFITNGAANLYYDNSNKLQTVTGGINVTGTVVCDGGNFDGAATFNDTGADADFRIESENQSHMFFVVPLIRLVRN